MDCRVRHELGRLLPEQGRKIRGKRPVDATNHRDSLSVILALVVYHPRALRMRPAQTAFPHCFSGTWRPAASVTNGY